MAGRALILDRDGVVNVDTGHVYQIDTCQFIDGIFDLAAAFSKRGFQIVIATNQAGIGRGYYSEADFQMLMDWVIDVFRSKGIEVAGVYHCPDHPTAGIGAYRRENDWRKPGPGMFLQAALDLDLDLGACWTVGDKSSDIEAGRRAGVGTLVLFDADGPGTMCEAGVWRVNRLASIIALLDEGAGVQSAP